MAKIENKSCNDHHVKIMIHGRKNLNAHKTFIKFERKPKMHVLTFSFKKKPLNKAKHLKIQNINGFKIFLCNNTS